MKPYLELMLWIIVTVTLIVAVYIFRLNFLRALYILRTEDSHPDWEAIDRRWYGQKGRELLVRDGGKVRAAEAVGE